MTVRRIKYCTRCRTDKATTDFARCAAKKDGLSVWCRMCHQAYNRERALRLAESPPEPPAHKVCGRCLRLLPSSEFSPNSWNSTGLQSYCRACVNAYARQYSQTRNQNRKKKRKRS